MEQKQAAVVQRRKTRIAAGLKHTRQGESRIECNGTGTLHLARAPAESVDAAARGAVLCKTLRCARQLAGALAAGRVPALR